MDGRGGAERGVRGVRRPVVRRRVLFGAPSGLFAAPLPSRAIHTPRRTREKARDDGFILTCGDASARDRFSRWHIFLGGPSLNPANARRQESCRTLSSSAFLDGEKDEQTDYSPRGMTTRTSRRGPSPGPTVYDRRRRRETGPPRVVVPLQTPRRDDTMARRSSRVSAER